MSLSDDNSLLGVVVLPAVGGLVGFALFGPFGFFAGAVVLLLVGAYARDAVAEKDDRIDELERRVEELEGEDG